MKLWLARDIMYKALFLHTAQPKLNKDLKQFQSKGGSYFEAPEELVKKYEHLQPGAEPIEFNVSMIPANLPVKLVLIVDEEKQSTELARKAALDLAGEFAKEAFDGN